MSTDGVPIKEEENVVRFLLQNPNFLENYLVKHTSTQFLNDVTSRLEGVCPKRHQQCDSLPSDHRIADGEECESSKLEKEKAPHCSCSSQNVCISITREHSEKALESRQEDDSQQYPHEDNDDNNGETASPPSPSVVPRTARKSVTSDLFHQWLQSGSSKLDPTKLLQTQTSVSSGETPPPNSQSASFTSSNVAEKDLELLEQNDRLMDLILDISNELDINTLCHKILLNVGQLTKADRCSLFLARGPRDKRYLEAKLFDVDVNTSKYQ